MFEAWEIGTMEGLAELCYATGKLHEVLPVVVFEHNDGCGEKQIEVKNVEELSRLLQE